MLGRNIAGATGNYKRVENDYYATDPQSVLDLLKLHPFKIERCLEPCVGNGNIVKSFLKQYPEANFDTIDITNRGFDCEIQDYLEFKTDKLYDTIITNPPYTLAQEFVEHSLPLLKTKGQCAMFLKIQFLEGMKRKSFFEEYPPKYVYVFSKRQAPWNNGNPVNEKGKKWQSTMCFAWFIWEKGYKCEPRIRWI